MHQRYAVEDDVERIVRVGQPGCIGDLERGRRIAGTRTRDHRFRVVDAGVGDASGDEIGKDFGALPVGEEFFAEIVDARGEHVATVYDATPQADLGICCWMGRTAKLTIGR